MRSAEPNLAMCGLDCSACTIYQARDHPEIARRIADWLRQEMGAEVEPAAIHCAGCRGEQTDQWSDACTIRMCCESRGLLSCSECDDLPCAILIGWASGDKLHTEALARLQQMHGKR